MNSVKQWLQRNALQDRRAALPVTRAFVLHKHAPAQPLAQYPARLVMALRSPSRPIRSTSHLLAYFDADLHALPTTDPTCDAMQHLFSLLAFSPELGVSSGALASACAILFPGGPHLLNAASLHSYLLLWSRRAADARLTPTFFEKASPLLSLFDWRKYLQAHGAHLEPVTSVPSDERLTRAIVGITEALFSDSFLYSRCHFVVKALHFISKTFK